MNIDDAWRVLGIGVTVRSDDVRAAFRHRLHERHPDKLAAKGGVEGGRADRAPGGHADADTRELIVAYRLAIAHCGSTVPEAVPDRPVEAPRPEAGMAGDGGDVEAWRIGSDTIAFSCPADEAYPYLVNAAHQLGDVTHVDRSSFEFLEFLVRSVSGDAISVVCSLQGRANASTEAFFTCEPLAMTHGPIPDVEEIVGRFIETLGR